MKKILLALFFVFVACPSSAGEEIFLPDVGITGVDAAEQALRNRKWTITHKDDASVHATIARFGRDAKADIVIYARANNLYYDGKALTHVRKKSRTSSQREMKEVEVPIPTQWVRKLQNDTDRIIGRK